MSGGRLFVSKCRLITMLQIKRRYFVTLYKKDRLDSRVCHFAPSAVFVRSRSTATDSKDDDRSATFSSAAWPFLVAAVFLPAVGILFYYRRQLDKSLHTYETENVYQTPFVDSRTRSLVQHSGHWFPVVMFPTVCRFQQIRNFTLEDDDILIVSFPKSGRICILLAQPAFVLLIIVVSVPTSSATLGAAAVDDSKLSWCCC